MNILSFIYFAGATFILAFMAIYAREKKPDYYAITKPLPLSWIIIWSLFFLNNIPEIQETILPWILFGLFLGLLGDIFLLKKETFALGFIGFVGGHVVYAIAFSKSNFILSPLFVSLTFLPGLLFAIIITLKTKHKKEMPFVWLYCAIISTMLLFALNTGFVESGGRLLALGCLLFFISDGFWSWNKFVKKLPWPGIMILSTYYSGQALITYGAFQIIWNS